MSGNRMGGTAAHTRRRYASTRPIAGNAKPAITRATRQEGAVSDESAPVPRTRTGVIPVVFFACNALFVHALLMQVH